MNDEAFADDDPMCRCGHLRSHHEEVSASMVAAGPHRCWAGPLRQLPDDKGVCTCVEFSPMCGDEFDDRLTALAEQVSPRVEGMLTELGRRLSNVLVANEVVRADVDLSWCLELSPFDSESSGADDAGGVDVVLSLETEREHEGGDSAGCAFRLAIGGYGGGIVGIFTPYNYTKDVWVPVDAHMEQNRRLALVEDYLDNCAEFAIRDWIAKEEG